MPPTENRQFDSPAVLGRQLPSYETLAYLEKLGVVITLACVIAYLVGRSLHGGPITAMREVSGLGGRH
jgi:hypothetical protein